MNTEQKIITRISWMTNLSPDRIHRHTHLKDDLLLDSLDIMMLIVELESWFRVTLSTKEVEGIETINDACNCIESRLSLA